jgi:ATP-dependent protease Clp ATPase subunit
MYRPFWQVESRDLMAYGLIPEFIGRFPNVVSLEALTEDQLVQVRPGPLLLFIVWGVKKRTKIKMI